MKRTEITYRKINKHIVEVLDIKNVARPKDLPIDYFILAPQYYPNDVDNNSITIHIFGEPEFELIKGKRYDTLVFAHIINTMRIAGEKLTKMRKIQMWIQVTRALYFNWREVIEAYFAKSGHMKEQWKSKVIRQINKDGSITLII